MHRPSRRRRDRALLPCRMPARWSGSVSLPSSRRYLRRSRPRPVPNAVSRRFDRPPAARPCGLGPSRRPVRPSEVTPPIPLQSSPKTLHLVVYRRAEPPYLGLALAATAAGDSAGGQAADNVLTRCGRRRRVSPRRPLWRRRGAIQSDHIDRFRASVLYSIATGKSLGRETQRSGEVLQPGNAPITRGRWPTIAEGKADGDDARVSVA